MDGDHGEQVDAVDWGAFELDLTIYAATRNVDKLIEGGSRIAQALGLSLSPASFVLGALFRELTETEAPDFEARVEAIRRLAHHAATVDPAV
jgi:hypothetical protein